MRCSNCAHHDLVAIQLTIASEEVAFYRCPRCDARTWTGSTGELTRDGVLELVRAGR
ncbi:MAG: hypothetical protein HYU28_04605 [Actinobacteria bacterium]|nr:hypothetical protein [Actinomycetota bacterium]